MITEITSQPKRFNPERLIQARKAKGFTQETLAILSGLKRKSNIWQYERNGKAPRADALAAIAHVLQVPTDYFFS